MLDGYMLKKILTVAAAALFCLAADASAAPAAGIAIIGGSDNVIKGNRVLGGKGPGILVKNSRRNVFQCNRFAGHGRTGLIKLQVPDCSLKTESTQHAEQFPTAACLGNTKAGCAPCETRADTMPFRECGTWKDMQAYDAPCARYGHSATWTGSNMLVWGGCDDGRKLADGAVYEPASRSWEPLARKGAPCTRSEHTATWTGSRIIVWGGVSDDACLNNGCIYNPENDSWLPIAGAPLQGRKNHTALWTGKYMLIWGGEDSNVTGIGDGALYNPGDGSWTPMPPAPGRVRHSAVWTGRYMLVWGGENGGACLDTGLKYDVEQGTWSDLPPSPLCVRKEHSAVWTGEYMVVFGGRDGSGDCLDNGAYLNLETGAWTAVPAPPTGGRACHAAAWISSGMLVWGGEDRRGRLTSGAILDRGMENWRIIDAASAPAARSKTSAVWTGREFLMFGGWDGGAMDSGASFEP